MKYSLSKLNDDGLKKYEEHLRELRQGSDSAHNEGQSLRYMLLTDERYSEIIPSFTQKLEPMIFKNRYEVGKYSFDLVKKAEIENVLHNEHFWSWISLLHLEKFAKRKNGKLDVGAESKWRFYPYKYTVYYLHYFFGPYLTFRYHEDNPERAMCLLCQNAHTPGDLVESVLSRGLLHQNKTFVSALTEIYYDDKNKKNKTHADKDHRFLCKTIFLRISQTWDIDSISADKFIQFLPERIKNFEKYRS